MFEKLGNFYTGDLFHLFINLLYATSTLSITNERVLRMSHARNSPGGYPFGLEATVRTNEIANNTTTTIAKRRIILTTNIINDKI